MAWILDWAQSLGWLLFPSPTSPAEPAWAYWWQYSEVVSTLPPFTPELNHSGLLPVPSVCLAPFLPRTFDQAVPCAWNAFFPVPLSLIKSTPLILQIFVPTSLPQGTFPDALDKTMHLIYGTELPESSLMACVTPWWDNDLHSNFHHASLAQEPATSIRSFTCHKFPRG